MKLINPSVELITQTPGLEGIYKQVERVGRVCYKSEDKITEESAKPFVERMVKSQHLAMLEHGTVYLAAPYNNEDLIFWKVANSPYSKGVCDDKSDLLCLTTNLRVIAELNAWEVIDKYLCEPTETHAKRITTHFICDTGVAREFCRHRVFSFAQESTRYCNYSKDKFGSELTFIIPCWLSIPEGQYAPWFLTGLNKEEREDWCKIAGSKEKWNCMQSFCGTLSAIEDSYMELSDEGLKAQEARDVLPLCTKTELVMTGFESDYKHFFDLRFRGTTGAPHPMAYKLSSMTYDLILKELGKDL